MLFLTTDINSVHQINHHTRVYQIKLAFRLLPLWNYVDECTNGIVLKGNGGF